MSQCSGPAEPGGFFVRIRPWGGTADRLVIERADPVVMISDELLHLVVTGQVRDEVQYQAQHEGRVTAGDVLTIDAANQRVVYVLRERLYAPLAWLAQWPD